MDRRAYNFSPGPATLPEPVLIQAAEEMLNYSGQGMGVMEMSHRSPAFRNIIEGVEDLLREVMGIPDTHAVLFLQGGATLQFAMVPINLMKNGRADYTLTGEFSLKAAEEAEKFGKVRIAASTEKENFRRVPNPEEVAADKNADYFHLCGNNTIYGTRWPYLPDTGDVPIVADLSSEILSRPIDVSKYGVIYAGAQKNMGIAGLTVVIIRKDLIAEPGPSVPIMLSYKKMHESASLYNTPPAYAVYMLGLVLLWIKEAGGLAVMEEVNTRKAEKLYRRLDESRLFIPVADKSCRSIMNVTFRTKDKATDEQFVLEAADRRLLSLKGHRRTGGMRASLYNAMPEEGVDALVAFMKEFEAAHGG